MAIMVKQRQIPLNTLENASPTSFLIATSQEGRGTASSNGAKFKNYDEAAFGWKSGNFERLRACAARARKEGAADGGRSDGFNARIEVRSPP